jgi:hypothetical protein
LTKEDIVQRKKSRRLKAGKGGNQISSKHKVHSPPTIIILSNANNDKNTVDVRSTTIMQ